MYIKSIMRIGSIHGKIIYPMYHLNSEFYHLAITLVILMFRKYSREGKINSLTDKSGGITGTNLFNLREHRTREKRPYSPKARYCMFCFRASEYQPAFAFMRDIVKLTWMRPLRRTKME